MKYVKDSMNVYGLKETVQLFNYVVYKESGHKITFQEYEDYVGGSHISLDPNDLFNSHLKYIRY